MNSAESGIAVLALEGLRDGTLLAGAADGTLRLWRTGEDREAILHPDVGAGISTLRSHWQHDDGLVLATEKGKVFTWRQDSGPIDTGVQVSGLPGLLSAFAPDGKHLLTWQEGDTLALHDLSAEPTLIQTTAQIDGIAAVDLLVNEAASVCAVGTLDGQLLVWDDLANTPNTYVSDAGLPITSIHISPTASLIFASAIEEKGNRYILHVLSWSRDTESQVWMVRQEVFSPAGLFSEINERVTLAHQPDTDLLVVSTGDRDTPVRLLSSTTGAEIARLPDCESVQAVAFSPTAPELALGHDNGSVSIWNIDESSDSFCSRVRILDVRLDANGALISGATGLDESMTWNRQWKQVKGTRLEFLADCGAVLDDEQRQRLAELQGEGGNPSRT